MSRRMSAKRMEEAVRAYFAQCDGTRERVPQKGGGFSERQTPYTLYGLSKAVSLSPQEVLSAAHSRNDAAGAILLSGLIQVAGYIQEKALLGELSATMAQAAIKELGLTEEAVEPLQVVLDEEAEAYSR
ncbi:MAG: hypothetical protein IJI82_00150 [Clostridia bacterium]|nr:hypothetical protein [Clostridia bacterium]